MSDATAPISPNVQQASLASRVWQYRYFYLFISPFFILFAIFGLYPLIFSLYLSTVQWDGLTDPRFVGLQNFGTLFQDQQFYRRSGTRS